MRVLITGGAGHLGASMADRLIARDWLVLALDNFVTSSRAALDVDNTNLSIVEGSIADRALVEDVFAGFKPEIVIHSAASYKDPDDWAGDMRVNALGAVHVVEAARRVGARRFVNFQTALCYGRAARTPIPIDAPLDPKTSYAVSKTAGEQVVLASDLNAVSLRIANVAGPRLAIGPIPTFYARLRAGKSCYCSDVRRDFLDMDDFLDLVDRAMQEEGPRGVFHASTGEGHTVEEVFRHVAVYLGVAFEPPASLPPGDDDVPDLVLDPGETARAFGWRARTPFKECLDRTLAWYDSFGVDATYAHTRRPATWGGEA